MGLDTSVRVLVAAVGAAWLILLGVLLRNRRLSERYVLGWSVVGLGMLAVPVVIDELDRALVSFGFGLPPNFFFFTAIVASLALLLHSHVHMTAMAHRQQHALQEIALLELRVRQLEGRDSGRPGPVAELDKDTAGAEG